MAEPQHTEILKKVDLASSPETALDRKDVVAIAKDSQMRAELRKEAQTKSVEQRAKLARAIEVHRAKTGPQQSPDLELNEEDDKHIQDLSAELKGTRVETTAPAPESPSEKIKKSTEGLWNKTKEFMAEGWDKVKDLTKKGWNGVIDGALWLFDKGAELWEKFSNWAREAIGPFAVKLEKFGIPMPGFLKPSPEKLRTFQKGLEGYNKQLGDGKKLTLEAGTPENDLDYAKKINEVRSRIQADKIKRKQADKDEWTQEKFLTKVFDQMKKDAKESYTMEDVHNAALLVEAEAQPKTDETPKKNDDDKKADKEKKPEDKKDAPAETKDKK